MDTTPHTSPADAFRAEIREKLSYAPREVIGDGAIHRFPTRESDADDAGWYRFNNDEFPRGAFGDWRIGAKFDWSLTEPRELSLEERSRLEQLEIDRAKQRQAAREQAAESALQQWLEAGPATADHPYLIKKGVGAHGLRQSGGQLLVPASTDGETIVSLQRIDADANKRFLRGGQMRGCYFPIGGFADMLVSGEQGGPLVIGEGYATCATIYEATGLPVFVAFNAGNLEPVAKSISRKFPAARIIIAADDDFKTEQERGFNPGVREATRAAKAVNGIVAVPPFDRGKDGAEPSDWNDFAALHEKYKLAEAFKRQLDDAEIARLAALDDLAYDRERENAAKELDVRTTTLDKMVAAQREQSRTREAEALCPDIKPWSEPVDLAELFDEVRATISRFIVCDGATATAAALWIGFTWTIEHVQVAPLAVITAPEKRCGKTQLLDVIGRLSRRALFASNISPAATFRVIEAQSPTLLIDEADTFLRANEELRGIINSGHTRQTAFVIRTVGDDHEVKRFSTWGAKAIAGIGRLAPTLMDRSIVLSLRRKLPHEQVERLRQAEPALFEVLARKLARFGHDHGATIRRARPSLPEALNDRAQDNWEPLLAIADLAGRNWPQEARAAALTISGERQDGQSSNEQLLADIRDIFTACGVDRLSMAELSERLCENETAPWATWNKGRPMSPRQLGDRLRTFEIIAQPLRIAGHTSRGFERSQFDDAWRRYLDSGRERGGLGESGRSPPSPSPSVTQLQANEFNWLGVTDGVTGENPVGYKEPLVTAADKTTDGAAPVTETPNVTEETLSVTRPATPNAMDYNQAADQLTASDEARSPSESAAEKAPPKVVIRI